MTETEWRNLGVQQSPGWVHYMIHVPGILTVVLFEIIFFFPKHSYFNFVIYFRASCAAIQKALHKTRSQSCSTVTVIFWEDYLFMVPVMCVRVKKNTTLHLSCDYIFYVMYCLNLKVWLVGYELILIFPISFTVFCKGLIDIRKAGPQRFGWAYLFVSSKDLRWKSVVIKWNFHLKFNIVHFSCDKWTSMQICLFVYERVHEIKSS